MTRSCRRVAVVVIAAACAVVALGGCGITEKKAQADRIRDSVDLVEKKATAAAELRQSVTLLETRAASVPGMEIGATTPEVLAPLRLELARRRVAAGVDADGASFNTQVFDDTTLFQAKLAEPGVQEAPGRSWMKIELRDLYEDREQLSRTAVGSNLVNPAYMVDLLRGTLTGSVKQLGSEDVRGVEATHFSMNISPQKAFGGAPKARQEVMETSLRMMGVTSDVVASEVWLDDAGLPVRIALRLKQSIDRREAIRLNLTLDLFDFGTTIDPIALPGEDDTVEVDAVGALGPSVAGVRLAPDQGSGLIELFKGPAS